MREVDEAETGDEPFRALLGQAERRERPAGRVRPDREVAAVEEPLVGVKPRVDVDEAVVGHHEDGLGVVAVEQVAQPTVDRPVETPEVVRAVPEAVLERVGDEDGEMDEVGAVVGQPLGGVEALVGECRRLVDEFVG